MNRIFRLVFAFFIFTLTFSSIVYANETEFEKVFQSVKADDEWKFLVAKEKSAPYENLYAVNQKNPEKSSCVLKNPCNTSLVFSNLCYNPKNETLYFCIHNGAGAENGVQLFLGEGIYALKKDEDGNYSRKNLRRFAKLEPWLTERAKQAYLENPPAPDYKGFLNFLFGFADFDVSPVLCFEAENGEILLNEDALRYLHKNKLLDEICSGEKDFFHSRFEDFLFCLDENGKPSKIPAVTANHSERFYKSNENFVNFHHLTEYKGKVFMLEINGSVKTKGDSSSVWSPDFSKVYMISDTENDFSVYQLANWSGIKADIFETPKPNIETSPLFERNGKLYLRDVNHYDFWELQKDFFFKKISIFDGNATFSSKMILILLILTSTLLSLCVILFFFYKSSNSAKRIFQIQQKTREEISSNIHDSVVQDIRAIRLDVERLKVLGESEELQKTVTENLTECIKRMRDICYALNPAEIAMAEITGGGTNIISVVQTLCEQFSERTNIKLCTDFEENLSPCLLEAEKAKYVSRITAEVLSNVEKHSFATRLTLLVREKTGEEGKWLTFIFVDDGTGCDLGEIFSRAGMKNHFGLRNIKKYAELCGGKIEFLSAKNEGMQVKLSVRAE